MSMVAVANALATLVFISSVTMGLLGRDMMLEAISRKSAQTGVN
jgi:hypothetical protein